MTPFVSLEELIKSYAAQPERFMWFIGAGATRTAGMPTASDLIWELKFRQYCREENKNVRTHDWTNRAIQRRIQSYFDSKGAPVAYSADEYTYYFEREFAADYGAQQQFIQTQFHTDKIALNVGQRALAAMMTMGAANVVFTTNFDNVLETAAAVVAGKALSAFHLEGSYAALDALTATQFPLYAKLHGDFRYRSLKNLASDLKGNDEEIQRCFLVAASRFGLVVSGFSGRDDNVMTMFQAALEQPNPFPNGLFWTVTRRSEANQNVVALIDTATAKGIKAALVEVGTFDVLMSKLWLQIPGKTAQLEEKVRPKHAAAVSIPMPPPGKNYPIVRTNALAVTTLPDACGRFDCRHTPTFEQLREAQSEKIPESAWTIDSGVLYWGSTKEVQGWLQAHSIEAVAGHRINDPYDAIAESTTLRAFYEYALAKSLCVGRPVVLRRKGRALFAVASNREADTKQLEELRRAVAYKGAAPVSGKVPNVAASWSEAISIKLDVRNGAAMLLLEPDIWITPLSNRELATDFMKARQLRRYNTQAYSILNAWIRILLGDVPSGSEAKLTAFAGEDYPATFGINARTAYSGRA